MVDGLLFGCEGADRLLDSDRSCMIRYTHGVAQSPNRASGRIVPLGTRLTWDREQSLFVSGNSRVSYKDMQALADALYALSVKAHRNSRYVSEPDYRRGLREQAWNQAKESEYWKDGKMPVLETVEENVRAAVTSNIDLTPYKGIISKVPAGKKAIVKLTDGDNERSEKRRFTAAAKESGMSLVWRKAPEGKIVFVLSIAEKGTN